MPVLTSLFVSSTLVSQTAMDLFASLLVLTALFACVYRGQRFQKTSFKEVFAPVGVEWQIVFWIAAVALSFILSPVAETEWQLRLVGFKWLLVMYVTAWSFSKTKITEKTIIPASLFLIFCSAYAIFVYWLARDPINPDYDLAPWKGGHRTGGFLSNAMTFAHVYGVYFCLVTGIALQSLSRPSKKTLWMIAAIGVTGIALVLSFTRGVWFAVLLSVLFMAFIYRPKIGLMVSGAGAAVLFVLANLWPTLRERMSQVSLGGDERSWIWSAHWKIFTEHPWTGVGYSENVRILPEYYKSIGAPPETIVSHAHNQYLQWLAGTGVIGLIAYFLFVLTFLKINWQVYRKTPESMTFNKGLALGGLGAQIFFFLGGIAEANFEHSKMKYVLLIVWALVIYLAREAKLIKMPASLDKRPAR